MMGQQLSDSQLSLVAVARVFFQWQQVEVFALVVGVDLNCFYCS
jgi:hypothetical protein